MKMAAAAMETYSADDVGQLLRCSVCLDRYRQPLILPCQHTFCKTPCLQGLVDMRSRQIRCPECRVEHYVPYNGTDGFPVNRTIANFLDLQPSASRTPEVDAERQDNTSPGNTGSATTCGICEKDATTSKCVHCNKLICEACRKSHNRQLKFDVGRLVNQLRRGIPTISTSISDLEHKSEQVKQHVEAVKSEVRDTVERYIKEMKDREKLLLSELDTFLQGEQRGLRLRQENMEVELASIASYCDSTEAQLNQAEREAEDGELLAFREQCSEYMQQLRNAENETVPDARQVRFTFEGQQLQSNIAALGELTVITPPTGPSASPQHTPPARERQTIPTPSWSSARPIHTLYEDAALSPRQVSPPSEFSPRRSVSPPPPRRSLQNPSILRRSSESLDFRPGYYNQINPYQRLPSVRRNTMSDTASNSGYMFQMDTDTRSILSQLDEIRRTETIFTTPPRPHRNASSIFGAEWPGPGDTPRSGTELPRTPNQREVERQREVDRQRELMAHHPRNVDPRPGVAFSVSLDGVEMEEQRPVARPLLHANRRTHGRGRGQNINNTADEETAAVNGTQNSTTRGQAHRQNGNTRGRGRRNNPEGSTTQNEGRYSGNVSSRGESNSSHDGTRGRGRSTRGTGGSIQRGGGGHGRGNATRGTALNTPPRESSNSDPTTPNSPTTRTGPNTQNSQNGHHPQNGTTTGDLDGAATQDNPVTQNGDTTQRNGLGSPSNTSMPATSPRGRGRGGGTSRGRMMNKAQAGRKRDRTAVSTAADISSLTRNTSVTSTSGAAGTSSTQSTSVTTGATRPRRTWDRPGKTSSRDNERSGPDNLRHSGANNNSPGPSWLNNANTEEPLPSTSTEIIIDETLPSPPAPLQRRGTFVMDDADNPQPLLRPEVNSRNTNNNNLSISLGDVSDHELALEPSLSARDSIHQPTPFFQYKKKGQLRRQIGKNKGSASGCFNWPRGLAVSPVNDSLVIADGSNHRVQVFDCNCALVTTFGSYGQGPGEFDCLSGVAITRDGDIVIADRYNHRLQMFDCYGHFLQQLGQEGSGPGQLNCPWGVAVASGGDIYVCDKDNHRIQVFRRDGTFHRQLGSRGHGPGQFETPHYLAIGYDGRIIVADTNNHRIQIFDEDHRHCLTFGSEGDDTGRLRYPKGVAVDRQGFIVVADTGNSRVQVFRGDGRHYFMFGRHGVGRAMFKGMEGLGLDSRGNVIVSDKENHRIQLF